MTEENSYIKQLDEFVRPAIEQLNSELSGSTNYQIEVEEGNNLKDVVSRAIAQLRNETFYSDMVKEPLGIYLKDVNNPSGHRILVVTGFISEKIYIINPGIDGTIIDINSDQLSQEMIKNSLRKCFGI